MASFSPISLLAVLPLVVLPLFYGFLPPVTGPGLTAYLALTAFFLIALNPCRAKEGLPAHRVLSELFAPIFLTVASTQASALIGDHALALSGALLYGLALKSGLNSVGLKLIAPGILAGGWMGACLYLGAQFLHRGKFLDPVALGNKNVLALYIVLTLPLAFHLFLENRSKGEGKFYLGATIFFILTLFYLQAAGTWIALLGAWAIIGAPWRRDKTSNAKSFALAAAAIGCIILIKALLHPDSIMHRLEWQKSAWRIWRDHLFLGSARLGGFSALYPMYRESKIIISSNFSHNVFLEILCNWGLAGASLLTVFLWKWGKNVINKPSWPVRMALAIAFISGLYDNSLLFLPNITMMIAMTMTGFHILPALPLRASNKSPGEEPAQSSINNRASRKRWTFVLKAGCAVTALFLISAASQLALSRFWNFMASSEVQTRDNARKDLKRSLRWNLRNPLAWFDLSRLETLRANSSAPRWAWAIQAQRTLVGIEPYRQRHWRDLARQYRLSTLP